MSSPSFLLLPEFSVLGLCLSQAASVATLAWGIAARFDLVATAVVGKGAADEHSTQKLAATPDFGQRWVVLQSV